MLLLFISLLTESCIYFFIILLGLTSGHLVYHFLGQLGYVLICKGTSTLQVFQQCSKYFNRFSSNTVNKILSFSVREEELLLSLFRNHEIKLVRLLMENPSLFILGFQQSRQHFMLFLPRTENGNNWNTFISPVLSTSVPLPCRNLLACMPQTALLQLSMKFLLMTLPFLINIFIPQNNTDAYLPLSPN